MYLVHWCLFQHKNGGKKNKPLALYKSLMGAICFIYFTYEIFCGKINLYARQMNKGVCHRECRNNK